MTKEQQDKTLEIIAELVSVHGLCEHFDHHGYCQTHFTQPKEACLVKKAIDLLTSLGIDIPV